MLGICQHVAGLDYTEDDLRGMYRARSRVVHGQEYEYQDPEIKRLYGLLESSMRTILRTLVINRDLARRFESDKTIRAALPLDPRS